MTTNQQDTGYAAERWAFDEEVTRVFENMLERSIPEYKAMRAAVVEIARPFVKSSSSLLDIGCSQGGAIATFRDELNIWKATGLEVSEPMYQQAVARFEHSKNIDILNWDLRQGLPGTDYYDIATSILSLMFIPVEHRYQLLQKMYQRLTTGGALILVEKVLGNYPALDASMVDAYYGRKRANGYTQEDIDRKRLALEGVLVPMTAKGNEDLLASVGFTKVDCFWRWMNFAGWVAVK
jgi:tRNA (cmo5U34)-methyltransferase